MTQQDFLPQHTDPVVIGGVGGSGTRLIAQCLKDAGFYIGYDLNVSNDNLWFTLLFRRFEILSSSEKEFDELLKVFLVGMAGITSFTEHQIQLIETLASQDRGLHPSIWLQQRKNTLLEKKTRVTGKGRWGWKEPSSHIVIDRLVNRLTNMKYIHVVRNGLDMAHSKNQHQLRLWGSHFIDEAFEITPYFSLRYWCIVHKRVLHIGRSMNKNFLFLNYDDFCMNPKNGIKQLSEFLGLEVDPLMPQLLPLVKPPSSIGRFKNYGTEIFAEEDVAYVKSLGFDVSS